MQQDRSQDQRHQFDMFGGFGNFGGLGGSISGRDPFDDPFFTTRPSGCMFNQSNLVGGSRPVIPPADPIIRELNSDDDEDEPRENNNNEGDWGARTANEPFINHPDDETSDDERDPHYREDDNRAEGAQPRAFKVHSCKVTYGGVDGVYYSSSSTRRMGSDGVIVEECKEADKSKGEAKHRISRGLHDKGHTVTRKLNSDGKVDTSQTLHNLHEDELGSFEEAWRSNSGNHLPHWTGPQGTGMGSMSNTFLLPSTRHMGSARGTGPNDETRFDPAGGRSRKVVRIPIE